MLRRLLFFPLAAAVICGLPHASFAQGKLPRPKRQPDAVSSLERPSHRSLNDATIDPGQIEPMLLERLRRATESGELRDKLRDLLKNPELLKEMTNGKLSEEQFKLLQSNPDAIMGLMNDPRVRQLVDEALKQKQGEGKLSEEQIETLKKLAENRFDPKSLPELPEQAAPQPRAPVRPQPPQPEEQPNQENGGNPPSPENTAPSPPSGSASDSWLTRKINEWSKSLLVDLNDPSNAESFRDLMRSLHGVKPGADGSEQLDFVGLWKSVAEDLGSWLPEKGDLPGGLGSFWEDLRDALPELGGSVGGVLQQLPAGDPVSRNDAATYLVWGVAAASLALLVWRLTTQRRVTRAADDGHYRLGSWPVRPQAVATLHDVRQAFEYLARLRLGKAAQKFNHRELAEHLGGADPDAERRRAARELAQLYERARYEPHPVPLAAGETQAVRRDLLLLAGSAG